MAYVLLCALRRIGLHDSDLAQATCGTIRLKLLKIGALVRISVRRIKIAMASACGTADCCACAGDTHAAAPSPAMNSRRRISHASEVLYGEPIAVTALLSTM
jgi:hypothetical protein